MQNKVFLQLLKVSPKLVACSGPKALKTVFCERYVDDISALIEKSEQVLLFVNNIKKYVKISTFSLKLRFWRKRYILQAVFSEKMGSVAYMLILAVSQHLNINLLYTFLGMCFFIVFHFSKFDFEVETLKKIFTKTLTQQNQLTVVYSGFSITQLLKDLFLLLYSSIVGAPTPIVSTFKDYFKYHVKGLNIILDLKVVLLKLVIQLCI